MVRNLESDQISTEGDIIKLKFIITHQEDRIEQLQKISSTDYKFTTRYECLQ